MPNFLQSVVTIIHYQQQSMQLNLKLKRSASVSSAGKKFDYYFTLQGQTNKGVRHNSLQKLSTQKSISLPQLKQQKAISQKHLNLEKKGQRGQSQQRRENSQKPQKNREIQMKVQKQIEKLRQNTFKSKRLVISSTKKESVDKAAPQNVEQPKIQPQCQQIESWQQIKKAAPKTGYLYIDCKNEPKLGEKERKVTLSNKYVLITEPESQTIYKIDEYSNMLKSYAQLSKNCFFKNFLAIKAFRKWKIIYLQSVATYKKCQIENKVSRVYQESYLQLKLHMQKICKFKFISSSSLGNPSTFTEYSDYLFNSSIAILEEINNFLFGSCVDIILLPLKEAVMSIKIREEEKLKLRKEIAQEKEFISDYFEFQNKIIQERLKGRLKRLRFIKHRDQRSNFNFLNSTTVQNQFLEHQKSIKKCLLIFAEYSVQWVKNIYNEILQKIKAELQSWHKQKPKFIEILNILIYKSSQKHQLFSPEHFLCEMKSISYQCELNADNNIQFKLTKNSIYELFKQYAQYLIQNLSFHKLIQSYAFQKYKILPQQLMQNLSKYPEIQLIIEIQKHCDCYNAQSILKDQNSKKQFNSKLSKLVNSILQQVQEIIDFYNTSINNFYNQLRNLQQKNKNPSMIYEYLEAGKTNLYYLPKTVKIGLFILSFQEIFQFIEMSIKLKQATIYSNFPLQFKNLYERVRISLQNSYCNIKNSMWTIDELLVSYSAFEWYQHYKLNSLPEDLQKFKAYLQVISNKCNQKYQQAFIMFIQIKELKDKLDIKSQIFTQKIAQKLKYFKLDIEKLREKIWKNLFQQQTYLIQLCKEQITVTEKLTKFKKNQESYKQIKNLMQKLQKIGKLELQYFIDQQLSVNTHSYLKIINDNQLLIKFSEKYLNFKEQLNKIYQISIFQLKTRKYIDFLIANITEIKEMYLLLVVYQPFLRDLLNSYEEWKKYLETVEQVAYLPINQLETIESLKELSSQGRLQSLTLSDCIRISIYKIYQQIHQLKQRKIKMLEMNELLSFFLNLQKQHPLEFKRATQKTLQQKMSNHQISYNSSKSKKNIDKKYLSSLDLQDMPESSIYEFQKIASFYKIIQQCQANLFSLTNSIYLRDYKIQLLLKTDQIDKVLKMLDLITHTKTQYNQIMLIELLERHNDKAKDHYDKKILIVQENASFFPNYKKLKDEARDNWTKIVYNLQNKTISNLLTEYQAIQNMIKVQRQKLSSIKDLISSVIERQRSENVLLNLVDKSTILYIILNPVYYFELFYPIKQIVQEQNGIKVITIYDELLFLSKDSKEQDVNIQISLLEAKMCEEIRKNIENNRNHYPIDNLLNYMNAQLPLQVTYSLDQLYLNQKYLSTDKTATQLIKNLDGEIKIICKNGLKQELDSKKINYNLALFNQLLNSRLELRTRIEKSFSDLWYKNILVIEIYQNMLAMKNFNSHLMCSFQLIDHAHLSFPFPYVEKALIKLCNSMIFQQSIVIQQSEMVANIAARLMCLFFKLTLSKENVKKVLLTCQERFPIFIVGIVNDLKEQLLYIYEELNRIQRINSSKSFVSKDTRVLPSLFILPHNYQQIELDQTLKLRFRKVEAVVPCPKILLCAKMLSKDFLIDKGLFLDLIYVLRGYIVMLKQRSKVLSFHQIDKICQNVLAGLKKFSMTSNELHEQIMISLFKDYFQAIGLSFQEFYKNYVLNNARTQYEKTPTYDMIQNIILSTNKETSIDDQITVPSTKSHHQLQNVLQKFCQASLPNSNMFINKFKQLFQLVTCIENRPIAIIGPYQSGKSLILRRFFEFLQETIGINQIYWRFCNIQMFNELFDTAVSQNQPIIRSFLNDYEDKAIYWLVFEGFISNKNITLLQYLFSKATDQEQIIITASKQANLSFCQLHRQKQIFYKQMKTMHAKYTVFQLNQLTNISPSYICLMKKIYLNDQTLDLSAIYNLSVSNFLKQTFEMREQFYTIISADFAQLKQYFSLLLQEILQKKLRSFEWVVQISKKQALERSLTYFFSFFTQIDRHKFTSVFEGEDHYNKLCKLITYSFNITILNFVNPNSHRSLQKAIKSIFYSYNDNQERDNFLTKFVLLADQKILYLQFEKLIELRSEVLIQPCSASQDIQTEELMIFSKKYLLQLVKMHVPIMILGNRQSGKSTLIKYFLNKNFNNKLILSGNTHHQSLKESVYKINSLGWENTTFKQNSSFSMHGKYKKIDYIIFIDDVSCQPKFTTLQLYLKYINKHSMLIPDFYLKIAPMIAFILERRTINDQLKGKLWDTFIIYFQPNKDYYQRIFGQYTYNKVTNYIKNKFAKTLNPAAFNKIAENYVKGINFCSDSFKKGYHTWTYQFGMNTLKHTIDNFLKRYPYNQLTTQQNFGRKILGSVCFQIKCRFQQSKELQKLSDMMCSTLSKFELQQVQKCGTYLNLFNKIALQKQEQLKRTIKNVIFTTEIFDFAVLFDNALSISDCILVNKFNIPFNRSICSVVLQMVNKPVKEILYCDCQSKFLSQIEKESEANNKRNEKTYFYLSIQELVSNPTVISYVTNYIAKYTPKEQSQTGNQTCPCVFVMEYSVTNFQSIAQFLKNNTLLYSVVLYFRDQKNCDLVDMGLRISEDKNLENRPEAQQLQQVIKIAVKFFEDLQNFEIPKNLDPSHFRQSYLFSRLNFGYFIMNVLQTYTLILRKLMSKKKMLELSLSELNYMFKQYKQLKMMHKALMSEETALLYEIGAEKNELRRLNQQYNNVKSENLIETLQKNDIQINNLQRKKEQILSSEKIWKNIYRNTQNSISRSKLAEIKLLFLTKYSDQRDFFDLIGFVLGENTDLASLKKCFSDINIMGKVKEISIPQFPEEKLYLLGKRLQSYKNKEKLSCGKEILEWIRVGCRLGIHRLQKEGIMSKIATRIKALTDENNAIRQKNRIDELQRQIKDYQRRVTTKSSAMNILNIKIKGIEGQISQIKFQFDDLINFQGYCLQELQNLQDYLKKILNYCFHQTLQFSILDILTGEARKKIKDIAFIKLRKHFGFVVNQEQCEYFDLLRELEQKKEDTFWLIQPKQYLSVCKKRTIEDINAFLIQQPLPLAIIDRRSIFFQDTVKNKALTLRINSTFAYQGTPNFQEYYLVIIEADSWAFSIKLSEMEYGGVGKFKIFKYRDIRWVIPARIPIVMVMNSWGPDQAMLNFKVIDLEFTTEDFQEITHFIIAKQRTKTAQKQYLFKKSLSVQNAFMKIVHFICRKTQNINMKNKQLIKTLTTMIQQLNEKRNCIKEARNRTYVQEAKHTNHPKLCELVSKILELAITYFPSSEQTSFYFRDILQTSFHYLEMEGIMGNHSALYLIIEFLTEGLADKFPFIYLFYIKIHAVEEGIATVMQSANLSVIPHPKEELYNSFRETDKEANFFKYLPFTSLQLQKIYTKINKSNLREQREINQMIEQEKGLSFFNKLILKRALTPKVFQKQVGQKIAVIYSQITLKNKIFLRRYVSKHNLFCVCDASYWLSKLKFPEQFKLILFSEYIPGRKRSKVERTNKQGSVVILFDDLDNAQQKNTIISDLIRVKEAQSSFILFLKQFIRPDLQESFKFVPFQCITSIFEIKQLAKVSRSTYSAEFNKIIHFKNEMIKRKTFNERISYSLLFDKIREQIMNSREYTTDEVVMHVEWGFFQWDSHYISLDKPLTFILASLQLNKELITQYISEKGFLEKSSQILKQSRVVDFDIGQALKLAKKLKQESVNLQLKVRQGYKMGSKEDIFYRQYAFKKGRLNEHMQQLKAVADIYNGKVELNSALALQLRDLIRNFDFGSFGRDLLKFLAWKRQEIDKNAINLSEIQSELNLFIMFQTFLYAYTEFSATDPKNLTKLLQEYDADQEDAPSEASSRREKKLREFSEGRGRSGIRKKTEPCNNERPKKRDSQRGLQRSSIRINELVLKRQLSSKQVTQPADKQKNEQEQKEHECKLMLGTFRNHLFIKDNRLIILKPVLLKEMRQAQNFKIGEITLFKNRFRISTIDVGLLLKDKLGSTKEHRNSRFTPSLQ